MIKTETQPPRLRQAMFVRLNHDDRIIENITSKCGIKQYLANEIWISS